MFQVLNEQFVALHKAAIDQMARATDLAFEQAERTIAFNVTVAKQVADEVLADSKNVAEIKDLQGFAAVVRGSEDRTEKLASFGKAVYDHVVRAQEENLKFFESASAELNAAFVRFIDNVAKSMPVGGEAFAQQFKQFAAAHQNAAAQAGEALKQVASAAQSHWKNATTAAQEVGVKAKSRK